MLEFGRLYAYNYAYYRKLKLNLRKQGIVFIKGKNGTGKTTIVDILTWTLYGETIREMFADEVVGKFDDYCYGKVSIFDDNKRNVIERKRYKNGESELILNGDGKIEKAETQKKINELLGRNYFTLYLFYFNIVFK